MSEPWTFAGEPAGSGGTAGGEPSIVLVEGSTFCIGEPNGDLRPGGAGGLFVRDTRVISGWRLTVNGTPPNPLRVRLEDPHAAKHICRQPPPPGQADSTLLIVRWRNVGDGMREKILLRNLAGKQVRCRVRLDVEADFADLFEVKEGRARPVSDVVGEAAGAALHLRRRRGRHTLAVSVHADGRPSVDEHGLHWDVRLPARGEWRVGVQVLPGTNGAPANPGPAALATGQRPSPAHRLQQWRAASPRVSTADRGLANVLARSVEDIGALRIFDPQHPQRPVVAAGVPWFMALFGRDSLLTAWMLLPLDTSLAIGTLQTLADHQGSGFDETSEEEPGRILHEIRFGPASDFAAGGRNIYYGTADATALFVMLLGELQRWGSDAETVRALLPHADRALEWIERHGDADGDGFVEYRRKTRRGLANQGWKDSWNGITFADGRLPEAPIALAEVQAYCYAAYRARAHFAQKAGDEPGRQRWLDKAAELKRRFNEAFWLPERGWYALGLDGDKRPIDALASNVGHCLWTGIVDEEHAPAVAEQLLSPEMFTGWGIRTLASSMAAYNPMSYHNGTVWPHDNALCVAGLMRYGFVEHAQRVVTGLLDAATHFRYRLPELFCGFDREDFAAPVPFPTSCSPQAWAAASPFLLLRSLLRFDPELPVGELWCDPHVPEPYLPFRIEGLHLAGIELAVDVGRDGWGVHGLENTGITLVSPGPPA